MRKATIERKTKETSVKIQLNIDKRRESNINTGIGFFDHMLKLFAFHGDMALSVFCRGDLSVDGHHTVEDVGIILGQVISEVTKDKDGINRYGSVRVPMDESLLQLDLDISGRPFLVFNVDLPRQDLGDFETELTEEFFRAVAMNAGITLHINLCYGKNTHHIIEAMYKAFGRSLKQAMTVVSEGVPSTKGVL